METKCQMTPSTIRPDTTISMSSTIAVSQPTRVILRLKVKDFTGGDPTEYNDAIISYLIFAGRSPAEVQENRHTIHIEPFQDPELNQTSFHIILDIGKNSASKLNLQDVPHKLYRVTRDNLQLL